MKFVCLYTVTLQFFLLPDLIVSHALPVRCRLGDGEKGRTVEQTIFTEMEKLSLSLVGWWDSFAAFLNYEFPADISLMVNISLVIYGI